MHNKSDMYEISSTHIPMSFQSTPSDNQSMIGMIPSGTMSGAGYIPIPAPRHPSMNQQIVVRDFSQPPMGQPFDKCPIICSLFALLCCPVTYCCSLPALILSVCSYTDYRVHDMQRFRKKSDCARRLIITACVIGLIIVTGWSAMTYIYKESVRNVLHELITGGTNSKNSQPNKS